MASEDNEIEEENENEFPDGKSGLIFLIDSRQTMFTKDFADDNNLKQTKFHIAIKCCRTVMMNKIIARQKDLVGVVLFGTDKADPKTKTKHVAQLLNLNYPNAEAVTQLDKLLRDSDSVELQREWGSSGDFLIADALWYCSSLFSHSGANLDEKRILLFTDDDNPHASHSDRAHMARKRAKDLNQIRISLELLSMGPLFDYSVFYKELVETVNGTSDTDDLQSSCRLGELLERVNRLDFKTRRYSKIKWNFGKGLCVGMSLYTLYREATVLSNESLSRATNEPVKLVRQTLDQRTGELLLPSDIEEYITIADQDIVFSNEDKEAMRKLMEPGITLLGFKPRSFLSEGLHIKSSNFAFPEETLIKGSEQFVKVLVERCIAKNKVALCSMIPRNRAVAKYVCLIPSAGDTNTPFGFHVVYLPFYNEERDVTLEKSPKLNENAVELAKKIINKLKFTYKPSNFKNPKLQRFWTHLEALALEYDAPDTVEDDTDVPVDAQAARLGSLADEFNDICNLSNAQCSVSKRPSSSDSSLTKRAKLSNSSADVSQLIIEAIRSKKVDKFTIVQLKEFLASHNQSTQGMRKSDLVNAVYSLNL